MLLHHGKVPYNNEELTWDEFLPRKEAGEFPNGQLPVWVENGAYYDQSLAILRLLGKRFGYYPAHDVYEAWFVDATVDYANDYLSSLAELQYSGNWELEDSLPQYTKLVNDFASRLDAQLSKHEHNFICGSEVSIADFQIASVVFTHVVNENLAGGAPFIDTGKAILAEHVSF